MGKKNGYSASRAYEKKLGALWAATDMANILIASDIAEVAKRQQTTWLVLQLYLNYRSQGKIGGEELVTYFLR